MKARSMLAGLLGVGIAAALVTWAVQRAGGARFLEALSDISLWFLVPAVACEAAVHLSRAWRWTGLLASIKPVRMRSALATVVIGAAATHVVPLRLDELIRAKLLGDAEGIPAARVLATVAADRVIEILALGALLTAIAWMGPPPGLLGTALQVAWIAFLVGLTGLLAFVFAEARLVALIQRYGGPGAGAVGAMAELASEMATGLRALPTGVALGRVLGGLVIEWGATLALYVFVLLGFGFSTGTIVPLTLSVGGAVAYGVPNVPGAIGTFEATQVTALESLLSLPPDQALAVAVVAHAVLMVPVTLVGTAVALVIWMRRSA